MSSLSQRNKAKWLTNLLKLMTAISLVRCLCSVHRVQGTSLFAVWLVTLVFLSIWICHQNIQFWVPWWQLDNVISKVLHWSSWINLSSIILVKLLTNARLKTMHLLFFPFLFSSPSGVDWYISLCNIFCLPASHFILPRHWEKSSDLPLRINL